MNKEVNELVQAGGKRKGRKTSKKGSRKASRKASRRSVSRKSSRKASRKPSRKASRKASRRSVSRKSSRKASRKGSKASRKGSKASRRSVSRKSSRKASRKGSRKASRKSSKKSRRAANPQITVRGALVKYVWANLDVKKIAQEKGLAPIGVPAKIVNFVFQDAMKKHPMSESDKKSEAFWNGVQKTAMGLLKDNLQKYASMVKK